MSPPLFPGASIGDRYLLALVAWHGLIAEGGHSFHAAPDIAFDHADAMLHKIETERERGR